MTYLFECNWEQFGLGLGAFFAAGEDQALFLLLGPFTIGVEWKAK